MQTNKIGNLTFYNADNLEIMRGMKDNVLCMSSGTCTHFQIIDTAYVPLFMHGVRYKFLLINYSKYEKNTHKQ